MRSKALSPHKRAESSAHEVPQLYFKAAEEAHEVCVAQRTKLMTPGQGGRHLHRVARAVPQFDAELKRLNLAKPRAIEAQRIGTLARSAFRPYSRAAAPPTVQ
jgi:hypothetical protein